MRWIGEDGKVCGALQAEPGMKQQNFIFENSENTESDMECYNPHDAQAERIYNENKAFHALQAGSKGGMSRDGILHMENSDKINGSQTAIALAENTIGRQPHNGGNGQDFKEEVAYTQQTVSLQAVAFKGSVRRLAPVEAELLMGFPRNWTRIRWRGKSEDDCPDAPRYKCCGNSMGVNCMRWIGLGIEAVEKKLSSEKQGII